MHSFLTISICFFNYYSHNRYYFYSFMYNDNKILHERDYLGDRRMCSICKLNVLFYLTQSLQ